MVVGTSNKKFFLFFETRSGRGTEGSDPGPRLEIAGRESGEDSLAVPDPPR